MSTMFTTQKKPRINEKKLNTNKKINDRIEANVKCMWFFFIGFVVRACANRVMFWFEKFFLFFGHSCFTSQFAMNLHYFLFLFY